MNIKAAWKRIKALAFVLAILAAAYGGYVVVRSADVSLPSLLQPAPASRLFMSMEGFRFAQSQNGRVVWKIDARNADLYENKEAKLKDLQITFTAPDNKQAVLIGDAGTMDTVTGNASISRVDHEVRIATSDGYLLTTNSLFWKAGERVVSTPDSFKLLGSEIYLEGRGLLANVDMRTITVNGHVKAVLQE